MKSVLTAIVLAVLCLPSQATASEFVVFFHYRDADGKVTKVGFETTRLITDLTLSECRDAIRRLPSSFKRQVQAANPELANLRYWKTTCE